MPAHRDRAYCDRLHVSLDKPPDDSGDACIDRDLLHGKSISDVQLITDARSNHKIIVLERCSHDGCSQGRNGAALHDLLRRIVLVK